MCSRHTDPETDLIYLRNRYYDPTTAQFLTRDPGGLGDELGLWVRPERSIERRRSDGSRLWLERPGACVKAGAHVLKEAATHAVNAATCVDAAAIVYGEITSGGNGYSRSGRTECDGAWGVGGRTWTFGDVIESTSSTRISGSLFNHEAKYSTRWAAFGGWGFVLPWALDHWAEGDCSSFEHEAGYDLGDPSRRAQDVRRPADR